MCGIALVLGSNAQQQQGRIQNMLNLARYRGPDQQHLANVTAPWGACVLGANRLSIQDPQSALRQPMRLAQSACSLVFNGEIYNAFELRNQLLDQGSRFKSHTDTEVLLHWLAKYGIEGLQQVNGMYALAFLNENSGQLWLARDPFGQKPLFYTQQGGLLWAASEARMLVHENLAGPIDKGVVGHYLAFGHAPKGQSWYSHLKVVPPGTALCFSAQQAQPPTTVPVPYQQQALDPVPATPAAQLDLLEEKLTEAFLRHTVSQVPVGLFLSGGIDSTLMLALLKKEGVPLPAFTVANAGGQLKDATYARQAAQHYKVPFFELPAGPELLTHWPEFMAQLDEPVADSAALLTWLLARQAAQQQVKVILSGTGADELFVGYNRHRAYQFYLRNYKLGQLTKPLWQPLFKQWPHKWVPARLRPLQKIAQGWHSHQAQTFLAFTMLKPGPLNLPLNLPQAFGNNHEALAWALQHEKTHYLPEDILAIADRASMRASVEMRMPYLDAPLAQWVAQMPAHYLIKNGLKWTLKALLAKNGGKAFVNRPKEGFGLPWGQWLQLPQVKPLLAFINEPGHPIHAYANTGVVAQLLQDHLKNKQDNTQIIWAWIILANWLAHNHS